MSEELSILFILKLSIGVFRYLFTLALSLKYFEFVMTCPPSYRAIWCDKIFLNSFIIRVPRWNGSFQDSSRSLGSAPR
jgi:hypothetical protein